MGARVQGGWGKIVEVGCVGWGEATMVGVVVQRWELAHMGEGQGVLVGSWGTSVGSQSTSVGSQGTSVGSRDVW